MLLLVANGTDPARAIAGELKRREIDHLLVDGPELLQRDESLFMRAFKAKAEGIVLVDELALLGGGEPASPAGDELVKAALGATNAPGVGWLAVVTSRPDSDEGLRAIRKHGTPYTIVRTGPVFCCQAGDIDPAGRTVLVPKPLAQAASEQGGIAVDVLVETVAATIESGELRGGRVSCVPPSEQPLQEALHRLGAKPLVLAAWRARLNSWFGLPAVRSSGQGSFTIRRSLLGHSFEPPRPARRSASAAAGLSHVTTP